MTTELFNDPSLIPEDLPSTGLDVVRIAGDASRLS
jgi:hypothetical protein